VQTVLFEQQPEQIWRLLHGLDAAAKKVIETGAVDWVGWALGDNSETPIFGSHDAHAMNETAPALTTITYETFDENLGSSGGHNRLAERHDGDLLLILNPDAYPSPTLLVELVSKLANPRIGIVEARQIPLEHPRAFDPITGATSWASTCCMLVRRALFQQLHGFDDTHFFLHCDDVDFSWRARSLGYTVVVAPHATVFHDKRPTPDTSWPAPDYELYHSTLGRLMLATRWGRPDIVEETKKSVAAGSSKVQREAVAEFCSRAASGRVPEPHPEADEVAEFIAGEYAAHRF
jgi:hypothetical protein